MQEWEYKSICIYDGEGNDEIDKQLNVLGRIGWELVSISTEREYTNYLFKRPL
jgi:hypothetical protein